MKMYWPKFSKRKLFLLLKARKADAGCSANYIRWTKYVGLKLYLSKTERDRAYAMQSLAAGHKLGPRVGPQLIQVELIFSDLEDDFMVPVLQTRKWYGYFTEHLSPPRSWPLGPKRNKQTAEIVASLRAIGIYYDDLHEGNVSFARGKDRPVVIDFGPESCGRCRPRKISVENAALVHAEL